MNFSDELDKLQKDEKLLTAIKSVIPDLDPDSEEGYSLVASFSLAIVSLKRHKYEENRKTQKSAIDKVEALHKALKRVSKSMADFEGEWTARSYYTSAIRDIEFDECAHLMLYSGGIKGKFNDKPLELRYDDCRLSENFTADEIFSLLSEEDKQYFLKIVDERTHQKTRELNQAVNYHLSFLEKYEYSYLKGKGRKRNIPLLSFISDLAQLIRWHGNGNVKISSAERSIFVKFICTLLPLAGVRLSPEAVMGHIKNVIKETGVGK
ncbi:MAG: hypothetical protein P1R74_06210 [Sedimenticola sp.]|nr:hypothetical protein [Sedimenticola sp.]